ncbi:DUF2169 domain-containing protein [Oceanobacter mangrovi]|uniref:DUF2169 domain-containing protein n=1 Tax=Oceanobacter mangrovi TaxID=2862510 RepID=UPI001C8EE8F7|nr:DUF2169 domain-containing protein [Oceanobacter mangrovi]
MKISKARCVSAESKVIGYNGRFIQTVSILLPFSLKNPSRAFVEQDIYAAFEDAMGECAMDSGVPKHSPEYMLSARCFAPDNVAAESVLVRAEIGKLKKELLVSGERYWQPLGLPSNPVPFTQMPLQYSNAYGGKTFERNVNGKGLLADEDGIQWLANVEYSSDLAVSRSAKIKPASFAPLNPLNEPRISRCGKPSDGEDPYSYPKNIDWHYFNDTASDQWFDEPLTGEENFRFFNMHPEHPVISGSLPPWRGRAFIKRVKEDHSAVIEEIPMTLDTLWFAPHKDMGVLVFHGSAAVSDRYGSEIQHLLVASEHKTADRRDLAWYQQAMLNREDDDQAIKFMLYSRDIVPSTVDLDELDSDDPDAVQMFMGKNIGSHVDQVKNSAFDDVKAQLLVMQRKFDEILAQKPEEQLQGAIDSADDELRAAILSGANKFQIDTLSARKAGLEKQQVDLKNDLANKRQQIADIEKVLAEGPKIEDPDLQALLDFVEQIMPKSKNRPDEVDLMAVDMKKLSQLGDKIDEYVKKQLAKTEPDVRKGFEEGKAQLAAAAEQVTAATAEDEETRQSLAEAKVKIEQAQQDLLQAEADTWALLRGEKVIGPVFRPPTAAIFDQPLAELESNAEQAVAQLKAAQPGIEAAIKSLNELQLQAVVGSADALAIQKQLEEFAAAPSLDDVKAQFDKTYQDLRFRQQEFEADQEGQLWDTYKMGAHMMDEGLPPQNMPLTEVAALFAAGKATAGALKNGDWACLQFANETWQGLDLTGAFLEQTRFQNCRFEQVDFCKAILARASFEDCQFVGCNFNDANFGAVVLVGSSFEDCSFGATILSYGKYQQVRFSHCQLHDNQSLELSMQTVSFDQCEVFGLNLIEASLPDCRFVKSWLKGCVFIELTAPGLVAYECKLESVACTDTKIPDADFSGTDIKTLVFAGDCDLSRANFSNSSGEGLTAAGCNLQGADFSGASLAMAYLADANLSKANLQQSNFPQGMFQMANLEGAQFQGSNLFEANLAASRLVAANFRNSNCFCVNFLDATLGDTHFMGADLGNTLLQDWRP